MSPLTKLFVVLLVLVSVALSAGTITFVNKLDPIQKDLALAKTQLDAQKELARKAGEAAEASRLSLESAQTANNVELNKVRAEALQYRSTVEDRDAQIARLNNSVAILTSANNSQSTALSASEASKTQLQDQVVALRKDNDTRLTQGADQGRRINDLVAQNDRLEQERRNLAEQLTDSKGTAEKQSKLLRDMGMTDSQVATANAGVGAGAPALNGVIRERRNIAGKEYATISIGSSDYVTKGMQFKILDAGTGRFLGLLQVESVSSDQAIGQINADSGNLAQIRAGNVVKTQI